MRVTLESTTKIVELKTATGSVSARIWEGKTESGIPVHAYITRIAVDKGHDASQFDVELLAHRAPSPEVESIPLRMIL